MRAAFLGPAGTYSHEALLGDRAPPAGSRCRSPPSSTPSWPSEEGTAERALVPIENSLEGAVGPTLDALAVETERVRIVGEVVHPVRHALIAREPLALEDVRVVLSHPQANAQCARFIRAELPGATSSPSPRPPRRCGSSPPARSRGPGRRARHPGRGRAARRRGPPCGRGGRPGQRDSLRVAGAGGGGRRPRRRGRAGPPPRRAWSGGAAATSPRAGSCAACRSSPSAGSTSPASSRARAGSASATTCSSPTSTGTRARRPGRRGGDRAAGPGRDGEGARVLPGGGARLKTDTSRLRAKRIDGPDGRVFCAALHEPRDPSSTGVRAVQRPPTARTRSGGPAGQVVACWCSTRRSSRSTSARCAARRCSCSSTRPRCSSAGRPSCTGRRARCRARTSSGS